MTAPTAAPSTSISTLTLLAPISGVLVPLDQVPDPVFAQRLVGDGISIDPLSDRVVAPCEGRILQIHRAGHALTLSAHGLEIVIHIGLDTVRLNGDGFRAFVKAGDTIRGGDTLIEFDPDAVARRARSLLTQMIVTNMDQVAAMQLRTGRVVAGRDVAMEVAIEQSAITPQVTSPGSSVESAPIIVVLDTGLHARPAALLAAATRRFTSDVRLVKQGQEANARSIVSIMALEVGQGDTVTIVARGEDAEEAVATLTDTIANMTESHVPPQAPRTQAVAAPARPPVGREVGVLHGVAASPGVAVGQVVQLRHDDAVTEERAADPNQERRALEAAIAAAHLQLEALQARLASEADAEKAAIFAAHQGLLEDPEVLDRAAAEIRMGASAAFAWRQAYVAQADRLRALTNPLLAGRATDLRDVGRRVLHHLVGHDGAQLALPNEAIVVAEDLTPSDAASLDRTRVRGFCTTMGSATSHVAILARGMGIPAVAGIDARVLELPPGTRVVLDGDNGLLRVAPTADEEATVTVRRHARERQRQTELAVAAEPAVTRDGHRVEVAANIGDIAEARRVVPAGGDAVGLLRTEFLFLERRTAPTEDEQEETYSAIARALGPERLLVIRTLDVGGDKPLPYLPMAAEPNPFLGERGVRLTLARPALFREQVRAILRASSSGKVAIMFPMIATLAEWRAARDLVERERAALGVPAIPTGIMVETAAAALLAEHFSREADFLSVGTNDLTQYTLAMDRSNPRLAPQLDALHPAVLQLIERTVAGAHAHGRWVGVCGALAGDPVAVPVLVGLGVDELSTDVPLVPAVKARVRALSFAECTATAREALAAGDGTEVRTLVERRHG